MAHDRSPLDRIRTDDLRDERELEAEFEAHLAHRVDDLIAGGATQAEARTQARAEFGDAVRLMAETRAAAARAHRREDRASRIDAVIQDVMFAARQLRRSPGFALTALVTLAMGVGASATIVGVVDAVVLEPLPFHEPDRIVFAEMLTPERAPFSVAEPGFLDWRERARSFTDVAAIHSVGATLRSPGTPRSVRRALTTHDMLAVLGVEPALGRMFSEGEDVSGEEAPVALLSFDSWSSDFGARRDILGTRLDLDGRIHEVIGVMPEDFGLIAGSASVFTPLGPNPDESRGDHYLTVVARLSPDATMATATTELQEIQRVLGEIYPVDLDWSARTRASRDVLIGDSTAQAGRILLLAAGLLLVMACANVSNLLMVRATSRDVEMGLRAALGASGGRLVRQLFTESAMLAVAGGLLGTMFVGLALPLVRQLGEARIPRLDGAALDGTALFASVLSVVAVTFACGLAPVVQLRTRGRSCSMGSSHRGSSDPGSRLRSALVAGQVATTVVLLAGTGLLFRSFLALTAVDPGFDAEGTLAVRLDMPDQSYTWEERAELMPRLLEAVEALPGVVAVGATAVDPFSGTALANFVARDDRLPDRVSDFTPIQWRVVTPGFFEAMGMEMRAGRPFTEADEWDEPVAIVIGESLARTTWPDEDPLGRLLVWGDHAGTRMRVVGVVEDLRDVALAERPHPIVYRPHRQVPWAVMTLVARVQGDAAPVAPGIRARIQEVAPGLPVADMRSLQQNLDQAVAEPRFNLQLLSVFAVVGLLMAVIGIYGLTAFDVRRRFREIGIRLSLGAEPDAIRRMILRQRMALTAVGVVVGIVAAWVLTRWIEAQLFGITANDPLTWLGVLSLVGVTSLLAAYVPARRATRVDPKDVLTGD